MQEAKGGIVTDIAVVIAHNSKLLVPSVEHHRRVFGRVRRTPAWRAGGEARISRLKHTFGMYRIRYRSVDGVTRCSYWAGIANKLMAIGRHGR